MRGSRSSKKRSARGAVITIIILAAAAGAAVYFIGAAQIGSFFSEQVFTPVSTWLSGASPSPAPAETSAPTSTPGAQQTPEPSPSPSGAEIKILTLPGHAIYALCTSVHEDEQSAAAACRELSSMGGAGYMLEEGGKFKAVISAYNTREDAENVSARLAAQRSMSAEITELRADELSFRITAVPAAVEHTEIIVQSAPEWCRAFYEAAIALDSASAEREKVLDDIGSLKTTIKTYQIEVDDWAGSTDNRIVKELAKFLDALFGACENCAECKTNIDLSARLKYSFIDLSRAYFSMLSAMRAE